MIHEKTVSTRLGVGITSRASDNPGRRDVDGKHRGGDDRARPAATVRRQGRGGPDRSPAPRSHRPARRVGRSGLRGDPDATRAGRAGLLPPRAGRRRGGRGRLPGDVPRAVPPGRIDPGRGVARPLAAARGPPGGPEGATGRGPPARAGTPRRATGAHRPPRRLHPTSACWCTTRSIACPRSTASRSACATSRAGPTTTRRRPSAGRSGRSAGGSRGPGTCSARG